MVYDIGNGVFKIKIYVGKIRGDYDDLDDFDRCERENGEVRMIFEGEIDEEGIGLGDVFSKYVKYKFLDIVKDMVVFFNGSDDGGKVVISEYNVGSIFGNIGIGFVYGDINVGVFEGGRIIYIIISLIFC